MSALLAFYRDHLGEIAGQTYEHLLLSLTALALAAAVALPVGLWVTRRPALAGGVLSVASVFQTIPSLALLGFLIPLTGIGRVPAIVALFLYGLLPIVRNTVVGVAGVDAAVREAAVGMGMTDAQVLRRVELPLSLPVIFAGLRTAMVVNVGVATLAALVGAGGLGVYIFRGISLASTTMILAGALPAAALALLLDATLAQIERRLDVLLWPALGLFAVLLAGMAYRALRDPEGPVPFRIAMPAEFMERPDGYPGLVARYGLHADVVEMDHGLMYRALDEHSVDAVVGYSTDGEIARFGLRVLSDDRGYFPPYFAAPVVRQAALGAHPELRAALDHLGGRIDAAQMAAMNAKIEHDHEAPAGVAEAFLRSRGITPGPHRRGEHADVVVGSKIFAEQYVLAEMLADLVETYTSLRVRLITGLGGTTICFEALRKGEIDIYPEYTGTGLLAILNVPPAARDALTGSPERVYDYVRREFEERFGLTWLAPLGFSNTYALIVRPDTEQRLGVRTTSELVARIGAAAR